MTNNPTARKRKSLRIRAAIHRKQRRKGQVDLEEFFRMLSGIRDEMEREMTDIMGEEPKPEEAVGQPGRRSASTIWNKLDAAFLRSESVQDFAEQAVRDMSGYDEHKARHETDVVEQDRRLKDWSSNPTNNLGLK